MSADNAVVPERLEPDYLERDVLSAQQLAERLGWGLSTIYRMPLPVMRKGRRGRAYYWPDVLKYLRSSIPTQRGSR